MKENKEKEAIFAFLKENGIPYHAFDHPKADTLPDKLKNDAAAGVENATHCKNLVLANRQKTRFYLLTMPWGKRFRTGPVSRQMATGRLSFAEEGILDGILHTRSGSVSPLELIFDRDRVISFSVDRELLEAERICFHPSEETCTVILERDDFFGRFLPALGIEPNLVTIEQTE
ncbi:MAG: prolyl-tRNA synthetase associated domain-containing protein [Clostridia bacterium]|nr:prolyl-tRNA synthetase associated domain-containing protein [Clostridia bacterium]